MFAPHYVPGILQDCVAYSACQPVIPVSVAQVYYNATTWGKKKRCMKEGGYLFIGERKPSVYIYIIVMKLRFPVYLWEKGQFRT